jgi:hypothetical protein
MTTNGRGEGESKVGADYDESNLYACMKIE